MKKGTGSRRPEMYIELDEKTIDRYGRLLADGDYRQIKDLVTPPTTKEMVWKHLTKAAKAHQEGKKYHMPLSIANAARQYYQLKEKMSKQAA